LPENYFETVEDNVIAALKTENLQNKINTKVFTTPENYFDSIEDIVLAKLKAEAIQEKNSGIPKNYFDTLEDKVIGKVKKEPKVISLKKGFSKFIAPIAIAASLLLIFTLTNNQKPVTFESIAASDIENWIDNGNIDIDALNIVSMYPDIELNDDIYTSTISDEEVIDYLNTEDLDLIIYEN
ncbi:MAG: hypothetical protein HKP59_01015, partial [Lutibacter sp.]|uniref:hypothetical protein n=1 Tax=Lutibacter sp. TaxID=1925666 RepID=UPI0017EDC82F